MYRTGEYVPWFVMQTTTGAKFELHAQGGRCVILCFFESTASPFGRRVLDDIQRHAERFHGEGVTFVGVSIDPRDANLQAGREHGIYFCDATRALSRQFEVISPDGVYKPRTIFLDPMLRVASVLAFDGEPESYVPRLLNVLNGLAPLQTLPGSAPIIMLPNVFEPDFCHALIRLYEQHGGHDLGMMTEVGGQTVRTTDLKSKSRLDHEITDQAVMQTARNRVTRALVPEVRRAFQFDATRLERHIVACYDAAAGGHFKAHRDNLTAATAHRKFAVTINLNAEEYEGGDLWFPEYGSRHYRCPTGGAVVFSCTLLHEARPVTRGRRFAYLPFLYDEAGYQHYLAARAAGGQGR
jgi:predicted 2-oxoglutarate/Fe(II)-dependent dioxygenase YbiX/peroxiredoxin